MLISSLFTHKVGSKARYTTGDIRELEELFGSNLPNIPEGEITEVGETKIFVKLHPDLRRLSLGYVDDLYKMIRGEKHGIFAQRVNNNNISEFESKYSRILEEINRNIIISERRLGLLNLFWLSFSAELADVIDGYFKDKDISVKYQIHPLLSGFLYKVRRNVKASFGKMGDRIFGFNLGANFNESLIESIIDDQLSLTECQVKDINLSTILTERNKRYRLPYKIFNEIFIILKKRLKKGIQQNERLLLEKLRKHLTIIPPQTYFDDNSIMKILFNSHILDYLFSDYEEVGEEILSNKVIKNRVKLGYNWSELIEMYRDVVSGVKRAEIINYMRQFITIIPPGLDDREVKNLYSEGRLYSFVGKAGIVNNARKVTVVFADLRGFTKTSEGAISEKELSYQLYTVFDPISAILSKFRGTIDKFTGDGIMITFGVANRSKNDALNAVRSAIVMQQIIDKLRKMGKTDFKMGISIHTGRVYLAHFMVDEVTKDTTIIGRNVNLAGRLSSASGFKEAGNNEFDEKVSSSIENLEVNGEAEFANSISDKQDKMISGVAIDKDGNLYNMGIAVSRDVIDDIRGNIKLTGSENDEDTNFSYYDKYLKKEIIFKYVGDGKFKGVERSVPIYSIAV